MAGSTTATREFRLAGAQGDEHSLWTCTTSERETNVVKRHAAPDDFSSARIQAHVMSKFFSCIRAIDFERLPFSLESGQESKIVKCGGHKRLIGVIGKVLLLQRQRAEYKRAHTMIEEKIRARRAGEFYGAKRNLRTRNNYASNRSW